MAANGFEEKSGLETISGCLSLSSSLVRAHVSPQCPLGKRLARDLQYSFPLGLGQGCGWADPDHVRLFGLLRGLCRGICLHRVGVGSSCGLDGLQVRFVVGSDIAQGLFQIVQSPRKLLLCLAFQPAELRFRRPLTGSGAAELWKRNDSSPGWKISARHLLCKKSSRFSRILSFFVCLGASWGSATISATAAGVV